MDLWSTLPHDSLSSLTSFLTQKTTPLWDETAQTASFIYLEPQHAASHSVYIQINRLTDKDLRERGKMQQLGVLEEHIVWGLTLPIATSTRATYGILPLAPGQEYPAGPPRPGNRHTVADPFNPHQVNEHQSVFAGPRAPQPPQIQDNPQQIDRLITFDPHLWEEEYPLKDQLPADIELITLGPKDATSRKTQLGFQPTTTAGWLSQLPQPSRKEIIAGQSLAGLTALAVGFAAPQRFAEIWCFSPSLWWSPAGGNPSLLGKSTWARTNIMQTADQLASQLPAQTLPHLHLAVGAHEQALLPHVLELYTLLKATYPRLSLDIYQGGHDPACWHIALLEALAGHRNQGLLRGSN